MFFKIVSLFLKAEFVVQDFNTTGPLNIYNESLRYSQHLIKVWSGSKHELHVPATLLSILAANNKHIPGFRMKLSLKVNSGKLQIIAKDEGPGFPESMETSVRSGKGNCQLFSIVPWNEGMGLCNLINITVKFCAGEVLIYSVSKKFRTKFFFKQEQGIVRLISERLSVNNPIINKTPVLKAVKGTYVETVIPLTNLYKFIPR
ncbi:MAG: hypothetical protein PHV30_08155 [Candidatus Margulisbacteria bacterium]|nr:hypothetical protein [Candidatus Margulisiibacteriota bacterium]